MSRRVLVVEDEALVRELFVRTLAEAGFAARGVGDASACWDALSQEQADLIMLDLGLPGVDGMSLAREIKARGVDAGLMVVSRRQSPEDRVEALELGCDDFLVKPVHLGELCARAHAVARRRPTPRVRVSCGCVVLDREAHSVQANSHPVHLTRGEFAILDALCAAQGRTVHRDRLVSLVSRHPNDSDPRTVDALVRRIRRKLEGHAPDLILTVPGIGYRMGLPVKPA